MTRPRKGPQGFRSPKDPAKVSIERREPVPVNALGPGPTTTRDQLTPAQRTMFDAQLAAYRAARTLVAVSADNAKYGTPVHKDHVTAWVRARNAWRWLRADPPRQENR